MTQVGLAGCDNGFSVTVHKISTRTTVNMYVHKAGTNVMAACVYQCHFFINNDRIRFDGGNLITSYLDIGVMDYFIFKDGIGVGDDCFLHNILSGSVY